MERHNPEMRQSDECDIGRYTSNSQSQRIMASMDRPMFSSRDGLSKVRTPRSTQPSIPPGSVDEYQLRLGRQKQVWLIPIADERVGVQVKL